MEDGPRDGAWNMAVDEVLLGEVMGAVEPVLRLYQWSAPSVSFGYFASHKEVRALHPACALVRRWTGGGVVEHGNDLTYSLVVPRGAAFFELAPLDGYRAIHAALGRVLDGLVAGVPSLATEGSAGAGSACFENPVRHDLLVGGSKVAGAAQRRTRGGLLHQGSIQVGLTERDALWKRMGSALAGVVEPLRWGAAQDDRSAELVERKYGTAEWLERF